MDIYVLRVCVLLNMENLGEREYNIVNELMESLESKLVVSSITQDRQENFLYVRLCDASSKTKEEVLKNSVRVLREKYPLLVSQVVGNVLNGTPEVEVIVPTRGVATLRASQKSKERAMSRFLYAVAVGCASVALTATLAGVQSSTRISTS